MSSLWVFSPGIWWIGSRINRSGSDVHILQMLSQGVRPLSEPRRVCRRLQLLSRMEHHEQYHEQVFP